MPIRLITYADKDQIMALDKIIFGSSDGGWNSKEFDRYFSKGTCSLFYEEGSPDHILGYIFSKQYKSYTFISNIAVKKEFEGHGIGKELMKAVMLNEFECSKKRPFSLRLQAREDNARALNFYYRLGFAANNRSDSWVQMESKVLPEIFRDSLTFPTPVLAMDTEQQRIGQDEYSQSNYSFSLQFLMSLGAICLGIAFLVAGLISGAYPILAIGVGLLLVGTMSALHSNGFFSQKSLSDKSIHSSLQSIQFC